ncbi:MAG: AAC(3) family N-acetyltransferase, partial [Candidatus Omnitrophica bacterium]|nr:AAC(3) family N-acetyltransferase [Candidatus Omnitrophota bacterium]
HSDITLISQVISPGRPEDFCEIFYKYMLNKVGESGTLIFPTFNFGFCSGESFSIKETKSQMGSLTTYAMKLPESVRTKHPVYSFAVIGRLKEDFAKIDNESAYSDESIFGELRRRNGKIMLIDISIQRSMTFFHHIEEMLHVDYRYHKDFRGLYTDENGKLSSKTYSIFVRKLELGVKTNVEPMSKLFEQAGFVKMTIFPNGSFVKLLNADELYRFTVKKMKEDPFLLYEIDQKIKK